jgi:hypothetical protein
MPSLDRAHFEALAASYATTCHSVRSSLHVAYVYGRGGALLGVATNRIGSRSRGAGYSSMTIHAERAVLKAVGDTSLLRDATLAVIRVGSKGELLGSKPCSECTAALLSAMRKYGLRRVLYS